MRIFQPSSARHSLWRVPEAVVNGALQTGVHAAGALSPKLGLTLNGSSGFTVFMYEGH